MPTSGPCYSQEASIRRAVWRRDGLVSISNAATNGYGDPGSLTTKPVEFSGNSVHANARVQSGGMLKVEVLDADTGQPVPGFTG